MQTKTLIVSLLASSAVALAVATPAAAGTTERAREAIAAAEAKIHTAEDLGGPAASPSNMAEARAMLATARHDFDTDHRDRAIEDGIRAQAAADTAIGIAKQHHDAALASARADQRATAEVAHEQVESARNQAAEARAEAQGQVISAQQQAAQAQQQAADANARASNAEQSAAQSAADAEAARNAAAAAAAQPPAAAPAPKVETTVTTSRGPVHHTTSKTTVVKRTTTAPAITSSSSSEQVTATTKVTPQ